MAEIEHIKIESCLDMDNLHQTANLGIRIESSTSENEIGNSPWKRIKYEPSMDNNEQSELALDTEKHIKLEEVMLAVNVKVEEQESETCLDNTKLELLTEEFYIKPENDYSNDGDFNAELGKGVDENVREKEYAVVHRKEDKRSFMCYHCYFIVYSKKDLINHINLGNCRLKGHVDKISTDALLNHSKEYICIKCHKIFKTEAAVDNHFKKKHEELVASVSYQCKDCSSKTTYLPVLVKRITHPECSIKRFQCIHCVKTFKGKRAFDDHVIKNHREFIASVSYKIHQCEHCSYKTTDTSLFDRHMNKHPESGCSVKQYPCIHCHKTFKSKMGFDDHIIRKHEEFIGSVSSKIHQCNHCSYKTTYLPVLVKHMEKHPEAEHSIRPVQCVKNFQCIHCDKTFKSKRALNDHVIKNHEEFVESVSYKIHHCKHCSYKTTDSSLLERHMHKHPESGCAVKQFPCIYCDKTFKSKQVLDDHVIKNHEEFIGSVSSKIHQCENCNYKTTDSSKLTRHMKKHPKSECTVKQFPCTHCDETFKIKNALDDHVIKNHTEFIALAGNTSM